ncbi:MAG: hypothetical protein HUJ90_01710 [Bacteroidales bacterium]|nr:hypothetical protein [Bacteroidales bacterium]
MGAAPSLHETMFLRSSKGRKSKYLKMLFSFSVDLNSSEYGAKYSASARADPQLHLCPAANHSAIEPYTLPHFVQTRRYFVEAMTTKL